MARVIDIEADASRLSISFPYNRELVDLVRALPSRWFDRESRFWYVPLKEADEVVGRLRNHKFELSEALHAFFAERGVDLDELTAQAKQTHKPFIQPEMLPPGTWTVDRINHKVQEVMRDTFREELWLASEIQSFDRNRRRGHAFFELVHRPHQGGDPSARVSAVLWQDDRERIERALLEDGGDVRLRDGLIVRFLVKPDFYTGQGRYQLTVSDIDLAYTTGTIHQNREAIIRQLDAAGILDKNVSLPFPIMPLRIGLITSDGSDACADFLHELERAGFGYQVTLYPANVQGAKTERSVLRALADFARHAEDFDAVAIVRGGGARSDLAYFDTAAIGKAVCEHPLKVVVGVGHQRDMCLLDLVAHSEKTPTAAAQFFVERVRTYLLAQHELSDHIFLRAQSILRDAKDDVALRSERALRVIGSEVEEHERSLDRLAYAISTQSRSRLASARHRFARLAHSVPAAASRRVDVAQTRMSYARKRVELERVRRTLDKREEALIRAQRKLERVPTRALGKIENTLEQRAEQLRLLDPRRVLERGFALVINAAGEVVRTQQDVSEGERLRVRLAHDEIAVDVKDTSGEPK